MLGYHVAGDAHPVGHLLMRQALEAVQDEGLSAPRRQGIDCRHHPGRVLVVRTGLLGLVAVCRRRPVGLGKSVETIMGANRVAPILVGQQIARRAVQESPRIANQATLAPRSQLARIGLLDQISRRLAILQRARTEAEQFSIVVGNHESTVRWRHRQPAGPWANVGAGRMRE